MNERGACRDCGHLQTEHPDGSCRWPRCECKQFKYWLTPKEMEVLRALALSPHKKMVAERLNMPLGSAGTHLCRISAKLGVVGAAETLLEALRSGLLTLEDLRK